MHLKGRVERKEREAGRGNCLVMLQSQKIKELNTSTQVIYFYSKVERHMLDICPFQVGNYKKIDLYPPNFQTSNELTPLCSKHSKAENKSAF